MSDRRQVVPFPVPAREMPESQIEERDMEMAAPDLADVDMNGSDVHDFESFGLEAETEGMGEAAPRRVDAPVPWSSSAEPSATVVPFRRPRKGSKLRRRRRSALTRWLLPFAAACLIVGLPSLFVFWLLTAPSFAMTELLVQPAPAGRVSPEWVRSALKKHAGTNLWRLDLEALETRLGAHPWLADVGLRKQPPSTLSVRLVERRPAALYRAADGLAWVDSEGRLIEPVDLSRPQPGLDLPVLSGPEGQIPGAVELLREIAEAKTGWGPGLSEVEILGRRDFRLYTTALPFPLVVRQGSLESQARHLRALLPRLASSAGTIDAVDLRFARRIIIKLEPSSGRDEQRA